MWHAQIDCNAGNIRTMYLYHFQPIITNTHIQGLLPIHCGASKGLISTIEALLALDVDGSMKRVLQISDTNQVSHTPTTVQFYNKVDFSAYYLSLAGKVQIVRLVSLHSIKKIIPGNWI